MTWVEPAVVKALGDVLQVGFVPLFGWRREVPRLPISQVRDGR